MPDAVSRLRWTALAGLSLASTAVVAYHLYRMRARVQCQAWRRQLLNQLQCQVYFAQAGPALPKRVHLIQSSPEWTAISPQIHERLQDRPLMGVDCEWYTPREKGAPVGPVALIQLAFHDGWCVLVRLNRLGGLPAELRVWLSDAQILKLGVGINEDARKLERDYGLSVRGCCDLRHWVQQFRPHLRRRGLAGLAYAFLGVTMDKDWRVRASNWENPELTPEQIKYAANDALVAINIGLVMLMENCHDPPSDVHHVHDLCRAQFFEPLFRPCADRPFKERRSDARTSLSPDSASNGRGLQSRFDRAKDPVKKMSIRKTPLYHNARLLAPDGQPLCVCDTKKAQWYIQKGLGIQVEAEAFTVKLNFEPSGRPEGAAGEYYLTFKENVCVVCGQSDSYLRKYIVPHEYRKHFPDIMRDHQSHDILLMCVQCHQRSNLHDYDLRHKLAQECNAPIGTDEDVKVREDFALKGVRSAARALEKHRKFQNLPEARAQELSNLLMDYYETDTVTDEVIAKGANLESAIYNAEYFPHGRKVVDHYMNTCGIIPLEKKWREHFLLKMKPKFLPPLWSVDHQQERLDVKAAENRIDLNAYRIATSGLGEA
ncbi:hypothetical protein TCAL_04110 [Tigriopus californicus]|uniref:3'-5' exonuclease domain-containing protein n=1 Tax=Tigriopus californicus TaxID=6832 RepID=A0A553NUL4_TIGCA|nr:exonuclease 3'-5' domain-containing protein 2-like [Tigriopus californicus]TRY69122.1 hypothetical protein TCAL_04110 [Tigriopus californicus]|eukprot:TCALIF_04110-PA protein Name:"Similar to EXD2 Exonuclease 3'-5' domain-containing protein 2 (Homo sapiens)" AED:0.03 eAED:0.03 QI:361/1/1/1/1/1/4/103/599